MTREEKTIFNFVASIEGATTKDQALKDTLLKEKEIQVAEVLMNFRYIRYLQARAQYERVLAGGHLQSKPKKK